jgi:hypothetical protein
VTRNLLSGTEDSSLWFRPGAEVKAFAKLRKEGLLLATKKLRQQWVQTSSNPEIFSDLLEVFPSSARHSELQIAPEYLLGEVNSPAGCLIPDLILDDGWNEGIDARNLPPMKDEDGLEAWDRIFSRVLPLAREIEILDGYIFNDLRREDSVTWQIFTQRLASYNLPTTVHCISPDGISDWSIEAAQKTILRLREEMGPGPASKLEFKLYPRKSEWRGKTAKFHRDRYLFASFDRGALLWALGHGLEVFNPKVPENQVSEQPAAGWLEVRVQLSNLQALHELRAGS